MIDAGREDEYATANDLQNRFARQYYRHGLYTEAKTNTDAILSQVEQRFITHVYDKLRKRASYEEIASALQAHVIDPSQCRTSAKPCTSVFRSNGRSCETWDRWLAELSAQEVRK
jgi:hypothetical protein